MGEQEVKPLPIIGLNRMYTDSVKPGLLWGNEKRKK